VSVDVAAYRDGGEVSRALESDPLKILQKKLSEETARKIIEAAEAEVRRALEAAASAPWPDSGEAYSEVQDTGAGRWR
jgi:pyruvate dehydrogenase E1 component alpha subunit